MSGDWTAVDRRRPDHAVTAFCHRAETVYGLGANALSEEAVLTIFQVRFRVAINLPSAERDIVHTAIVAHTVGDAYCC